MCISLGESNLAEKLWWALLSFSLFLFQPRILHPISIGIVWKNEDAMLDTHLFHTERKCSGIELETSAIEHFLCSLYWNEFTCDFFFFLCLYLHFYPLKLPFFGSLKSVPQSFVHRRRQFYMIFLQKSEIRYDLWWSLCTMIYDDWLSVIYEYVINW
jgi:hypothetical protein